MCWAHLRAKTDEIKSRNCTKVLTDLHEMPVIGSTGIGFVVSMYISVTKMAGGRFVLADANHRLREVFDPTRLSTVIPLAADTASGLAALRGESPAARSAENTAVPRRRRMGLDASHRAR
jgi:anti-anti-sigma factor